MKKFSLYLKTLMVALGFLIVMPACTDLEEEVFDAVTADNFFQTEEELISALGAAYTSLYGYMGNTNMFGAQEVTGDAVTVPTRGPDWGDGGHWVRLHTGNWNAEDPTVNSTWNFLFGGVNACNRLIFQFEELQNPLTDPFIGELRALRGIYYMWLLDIYGNVPLSTDFAETDPLPNSSRQEVFNFVESELLTALDEVTDAVDQSTYGRVNKDVVHMALARLYLNAEVYTGNARWSEAAAQANEIINSGSYSIAADYFASFNADNSGSPEMIWAIPYDEVFAQGFNVHMMSLSYLHQETYQLAAQPWNGFCAMEDFFNLYDDEDLRRGQPGTEDGPSAVRGSFLWGAQWDISGNKRLVDDGTLASGVDPDGPPFTIRPFINELQPEAWRESGARIVKYEIEVGAQPNLNTDFPIFRYAEVLLIRAEALWRQDNGSQEALDLVNQLRERAGVDPFTELTEENLLAERGREMFAETTRRSDLIRFGKFQDEWWERPAQPEFKEIFPIPRQQLDANANLQQNPGY